MEGAELTGSERWSALEVRLLSAFVAVVETGSFTAAAAKLGYTQSGVSQQIASLERIVDRRLLVRRAGGRQPVELTPIGEALLQHSRALLGRLDRAYAEVVEHEAAEATTIRLSSFASASVHLLPVLQRVLRAEAALRVELLEGQSDDEIFAALDAHEAELAFVVLPVPPRFAVQELGVDPYVAVVPADGRLAQRYDTLPADELARQPLIGIRHCAHEAAVEARLAAAGVDVREIDRFDDNRLIQAQAAAGNAIAVVPSLTVELGDDSIRALPIELPLPPRVIAIAHLRDGLLSPAARRFTQVATPVCRRILSSPGLGWQHAAAS